MANDVRKHFKSFARGKNFLLFTMLQVTGTDDVIKGVKVVKAQEGSVVLDVVLLYGTRTSPQQAFEKLKLF